MTRDRSALQDKCGERFSPGLVPRFLELLDNRKFSQFMKIDLKLKACRPNPLLSKEALATSSTSVAVETG